MLSSADEPPPRILPVSVLLPVVILCLSGSWFMVPKRDELIERLYKDKQYERVVAVLRDDSHGMSATEVNGLRQLEAGQLTTLSRLLNLTPREQLRTIFGPKSTLEYDVFVHNIVLAAVRYVDVVEPQEVFDLLTPVMERVPEDMRMQLLRTIAHNAHAVGRPGLAASALKLACQCSTADWPLLHEMAQSYRWSGNPAEAADMLRGWLVTHRHKLSPAEHDESRDYAFNLALESGRPGYAFDICIEELQDVGEGKPIPAKLMETAVTLALQSSRTKDLVPWLARFVNALPASKMSITELHNEHAKDAARHADYRRWATMLAHWSDWNSEFDSAFEHHLRLAVMGDPESRDRCVALCDFLGRTEDCCEMLLTIGEQSAKPELALVLASQLGELGRDDEARPRFEAWLRSHPRDRKAHFDYACLLEDMGDEAASRKAFEVMLRAFPDDVIAMKRLATACIRDADYRSALDIYGRIPENAHDPESLESYAMTAESLDDHAAEVRALRLTAKLTPQPTTEIYLDLAEAASYLPDSESSIDVLHEGLARLPDSTQLRIALANHYLHAERPDEALTALASDNLKNNFEATQFILGMSDAISDAPRALEMLGFDVESRFELTPENRLQLAILHFKAGHKVDSDRLFATVKEERKLFRALAEARFHIADYSESARLMTAYLKDAPKATANEWVFLGDIYEQLGELEQARKAYDYSLVLLTANLGETASN